MQDAVTTIGQIRETAPASAGEAIATRVVTYMGRTVGSRWSGSNDQQRDAGFVELQYRRLTRSQQIAMQQLHHRRLLGREG